MKPLSRVLLFIFVLYFCSCSKSDPINETKVLFEGQYYLTDIRFPDAASSLDLNGDGITANGNMLQEMLSLHNNKKLEPSSISFYQNLPEGILYCMIPSQLIMTDDDYPYDESSHVINEPNEMDIIRFSISIDIESYGVLTFRETNNSFANSPMDKTINRSLMGRIEASAPSTHEIVVNVDNTLIYDYVSEQLLMTKAVYTFYHE